MDKKLNSGNKYARHYNNDGHILNEGQFCMSPCLIDQSVMEKAVAKPEGHFFLDSVWKLIPYSADHLSNMCNKHTAWYRFDEKIISSASKTLATMLGSFMAEG